MALDGDLPDREVGRNEGLAVEVVDTAPALVGSELAQPRPPIDLVGHLEGGRTPHGLAVGAHDRSRRWGLTRGPPGWAKKRGRRCPGEATPRLKVDGAVEAAGRMQVHPAQWDGELQAPVAALGIVEVVEPDPLVAGKVLALWEKPERQTITPRVASTSSTTAANAPMAFTSAGVAQVFRLHDGHDG